MKDVCIEIQKAVVLRLQDAGFCVIARESEEGAKKPHCSVEVLPGAATLLNKFIEEDGFEAGIVYYPKIESREELLRAADSIRRLFLYAPLAVESRRLTPDTIEFERVESALLVSVKYVLQQETPWEADADDVMETLDLQTMTENEE